MKIYTRTGDEGKTALFGGSRVPKDDLRVTAYGTVDEANAALGLARAELQKEQAAGDDHQQLDSELAQLQSLLFDLGADLATPGDARQRGFIRPVDEHDVQGVEEAIDKYSAELPQLRQFILPGGSAASAALQLARAVIRRAERDTVALARHEEVGPQVLPLINRLSDLFFTLARLVNVRSGTPEVPWVARRPDRQPDQE
jgi:cob(I)alamin adenosyltransferase